jgi:hypothetical protein
MDDTLKTHRGIYYWPTLVAARTWAVEHGWPTDRLIGYERGYAVQAYKSGYYAGPSNLTFHPEAP